jgi:hypothetical protein
MMAPSSFSKSGTAGEQELALAGSRIKLLAILAVAAVGFAVIAYGYWPGVMIDDARWQYQQAVDNAYEDWHPPLMAWIWRRLMFLQPGPAPMLLLQLALFWAGILLISLWLYRRGRPGLALVLACCGLLPAPLALSGTVTKDCLMSGFLMCSVGLLLWQKSAATGLARTALFVATLLALLAAAALRFNAFLACVPLALAALPRVFTRTWPRMILSGLAMAAIMMMAAPAFAALVDAEKTDAPLSLILFDLGGITERTGISQFPALDVNNPVAVNHRCYDPYGWDSYSDWAPRPCPLGFDAVQSLVDDEDVQPTKLWLHAVLSHPLAYAEHRLVHFNLSTWFLVPEGPKFTAWTDSVPNPWGYRVQQNGTLRAVSSLADGAAKTPLGWPIFWIAAAFAALIVGVAARARPAVVAVAASAFLYGAGYLVFGVATGMRYYMWTISGAAIAAILVSAELSLRPGVIGRRSAAIALAVAAVPTAMAAAARLLF